MPVYGFWGLGSPLFGEDVWAFGFPTEISPQGGNDPQPRFFKGHIQTRYRYSDRFNYDAVELSFPAPGGLSGGPVAILNPNDLLVGMVTTNHDSYTVTDSMDEIDESGKRTIIEGRKIVSYGLALALDGVDDWLDSVVPRPYNPRYP
jgi:hypothetical protein